MNNAAKTRTFSQYDGQILKPLSALAPDKLVRDARSGHDLDLVDPYTLGRMHRLFTMVIVVASPVCDRYGSTNPS